MHQLTRLLILLLLPPVSAAAQARPELRTLIFSDAEMGRETRQSVTIENTLATQATVTVTVAISGAAFSIVASTCTAPLPPGGACTIEVAFRPQQTGAHTGAVEYRLGATTYRFAVAGLGLPAGDQIAPTLAVTCPAQAKTSLTCSVSALADNLAVVSLEITFAGGREVLLIETLPGNLRSWRFSVGALPRGAVKFRATACDAAKNCTPVEKSILLN